MLMNEIEKLVKTSGLSKSYIARKLGIARQTLLNKLQGDSTFKVGEIAILKDLLNISLDDMNKIFFNLKDDEISPKITK